jgi:hypothetical protein
MLIQRNGDRSMHILEFLYEGRKSELMSFEEHRALYRKVGYELVARKGAVKTRFSKLDLFHQRVPGVEEQMLASAQAPVSDAPYICDHCNAVLDMPQPPECACGEFFCSIECHEKDWPQHKGSCTLIRHSAVTEWYWRMVQEGAIPWVGGVRDYRSMWGAQKKKASTEWDEVAFYVKDGERNELRERMAVKQQAYKDALAASPTPAGSSPSVEVALNELLDELLEQHSAYATPLPIDSVGRLRFKLLMLAELESIVSELGPIQSKKRSPLLPSVSALMPKFNAAFKKLGYDPAANLPSSTELMRELGMEPQSSVMD